MNSFFDKIDKYFSSKYVNSRGRRYIYDNNINNIKELETFLEKKRIELDKKGNNDGFGIKTLHDLTLFLKKYDEENEVIIQTEFDNVDINNIDNFELKNNDIENDYDKYLNSSLFSKYVYNFYKSKYVTLRSKGLLEEFNIKNIKDLNTFLKSNKSTLDLKGYGTKSISDLEILYEFLLKCLLFNKDNVESNDLVISNQNYIIESNNEKFNHEDLFKTYVHQYFNNQNITIRSKKVIEDLNIKNLKDLGNILKNNEKIYKIRGCGTKTITDLENLYLYILKKESELKIDNVNDERVLFYNILNISFIDDESLILSSQKKLNIFNFTLKYFDDIFSDLSKSLIIALKDKIGLELLDSERNKINGLTTERLRQLNRRLFENKFSSSKEKILKVLNFSDQNIIIDKPFILFKEEISKFKNDEYFNYRFILFIYFITANKKYRKFRV